MNTGYKSYIDVIGVKTKRDVKTTVEMIRRHAVPTKEEPPTSLLTKGKIWKLVKISLIPRNRWNESIK